MLALRLGTTPAGRSTAAGTCASSRRVRDPGPAPAHRRDDRDAAAQRRRGRHVGIDRRLWRAPDGSPRHHLLDPSTQQPAWTGLIAATALAPTALEADTLAKAALLSGPDGAARWLTPPRRPDHPRRRHRRFHGADPRGGGMTRDRSRALADQPLRGRRRARPRRGVGPDRADARRGPRRPARSGDERSSRSTSRPRWRALIAIAVHGVALLGDGFLKPGHHRHLDPVRHRLRPVYVGLGIIGGYLAAFLGLSFYARRRIGGKRWRKLHRATPVVYVLGLIHTLGAGTDAGSTWLQRVHARHRRPGRPACSCAPAQEATRPQAEGSERMRIVLIGAGLAAQRCAETLSATRPRRPDHDVRRRTAAPTTARRCRRPSCRASGRRSASDPTAGTATTTSSFRHERRHEPATALEFDKALIATGATPITLPAFPHAHTLRTRADAIALDEALTTTHAPRDHRRGPDRPGGRLRGGRPRHPHDPDRPAPEPVRRPDGPGRRRSPPQAARRRRGRAAPRAAAVRPAERRHGPRRHRRQARPGNPMPPERLHRRRRDRQRPLGGRGGQRPERRARHARPARQAAKRPRSSGPTSTASRIQRVGDPRDATKIKGPGPFRYATGRPARRHRPDERATPRAGKPAAH